MLGLYYGAPDFLETPVYTTWWGFLRSKGPSRNSDHKPKGSKYIRRAQSADIVAMLSPKYIQLT